MGSENCHDCGVSTFDINEYYMLDDAVWKLCIPEKQTAMLCISCVEKRLGRELATEDFSICPLNDHPADVSFPNLKSEKLLTRLGHLDDKRNATLVDVLNLPDILYHKFLKLCRHMLLCSVKNDWYLLEDECGYTINTHLIIQRLKIQMQIETGHKPSHAEALSMLTIDDERNIMECLAVEFTKPL